MLLFGDAQVLEPSTDWYTNKPETWVWHAGGWTEEDPAVEPPLLTDASMAYDDVSRSVILFVGQPESTSGNSYGSPRDDTWSWSGTNWTKLAPSTRPTARVGASLVFDPTLNGLVMFGGSTIDPGLGNVRPLSQMWLFAGGDWRRVAAPTMPPARLFAQMTFDSASHQLILFGGGAEQHRGCK